MKTVAVFTSIRSEYGPLVPLLRKMENDPYFELKLIVGGAHLVNSYGMTINEIRQDGFSPAVLLPFLDEDKDDNDFYKILGRLQVQVGKYLKDNRPDLMVVLGDRYELIPVVTSCLLLNVPVAHISGGEFTEGAIDNQVRHAVSKMSHLHFPATEKYADNLFRMGEEKWRICISGEPGLDSLRTLKLAGKNHLCEELGMNPHKPIIVCTFHPETITNKITPDFIARCLTEIVTTTNYQVLVTASNFDEGGAEINMMLEGLVSPEKGVLYRKSLGQNNFYSVLACAEIMLGNSSSGVIVAQSFNLPVINVGDRQKGRLANPNVHNVKVDIPEIGDAIPYVTSEAFRKGYYGKTNIYGDGNACEKIVGFLKEVDWSLLLEKRGTYS